MNQTCNIAVLAGGPSAEREISLVSGRAVVRALKALGHRVFEVDPSPGSWSLPPETELVFLALHGTWGEDGTIQAELDVLDVPYTGCGAQASRCAFDKVLSKRAFVAQGVPTAEFELRAADDDRLPETIDFPLVIKPACQGSSVGVEILSDAAQWQTAFSRTAAFESEILIEPFIAGREITVGILGEQVLPTVEIRPRQGYYDYHNKYTKGATEYICPASFDASLQEEIDRAALRTMQAIGGGAFGRVDLLVRGRQLYVLEVNTIPGMTETSLLPLGARAAGLSFRQLVQRIVELACAAHSVELTAII